MEVVTMNDLRDQQAAMRARQPSLARPNNRPGDKWLSQFMDYLTGERGYSAHTISAYKQDVGKFRDALAKDLLVASTDDVRKFVLGILERGLSPKTASRKLSAIKGFYHFVFEDGGLPQDPTRHIRSPKAFKTIIRPITHAEVDQTLASIGIDRAMDIRNRALVYVAYGSGVRVSELSRLKVADIDFSLAVAKLRLGKGQKDRLVPLNQPEMDAIRSYLETARPRFVRGTGQWLAIHRPQRATDYKTAAVAADDQDQSRSCRPQHFAPQVPSCLRYRHDQRRCGLSGGTENGGARPREDNAGLHA
jgi:site-specific recombinase XerD